MPPLGLGRVQVFENGLLYYSPNARSDPELILDKPRGSNPFQPGARRKPTYLEFLSPRQWTREFGYLSFIPLQRWHLLNSGALLWPLARTPHALDLRSQLDKNVVGHTLANPEGWLELEQNLYTAVTSLKQTCKAPIILPFLPNAYGFSCHYKKLGALTCVMEQSRDWFLVWLGIFSYLYACVSDSQDGETEEFPLWRARLEAAGLSPAWVDDLVSSLATVYTVDNARVGCIIDLMDKAPGQPTVEWFCAHGVPVWYRWGPEEEQQASVDAGFAAYRPPQSECLPLPLSDALAVETVPVAITAWLQKRDIENNLALLTETPEQRETRERLAENPPMHTAAVFVWCEEQGQLHRTPVDRAARFETLRGFTPKQRRYDPFSNEWDCSTHFEKSDNSDSSDFLDELEEGLDPQDFLLEDAVFEQAHADIESNPTPPPLSLEDAQPETSQLAFHIQDHMHTFYGMHAPLPGWEAPHSVAATELSTLKHFLRTELHSNQADEYVQTEEFLQLNTFFHSVASGGDGEGMSDMARSSHQAVMLTGRFGYIRRAAILKECRELTDSYSSSKYYYILNLPDPTVPWKLALVSAQAALVICRLPAHLTEPDLAYYCAENAIPFRVFNPASPLVVPRPLWALALQRPVRAFNHQFTKEDYDGYVRQRTALLGLPHMQAAIRRGGIIWRLAVGTLRLTDIVHLPVTSSSVSSVMLDGVQMGDNVLSSLELDLICGVYHCVSEDTKESKLVSWWPLARYFEKEHCGRNYGYWSAGLETWFQDRLHNIEAGTAQPLPYNNGWLKGQELRGNGKIRKFHMHVAKAASALLSA